MSWTFTISGTDGQAAEIAVAGNDPDTLVKGATELIHRCLARPVESDGSQGGAQERKIAGKRG